MTVNSRAKTGALESELNTALVLDERNLLQSGAQAQSSLSTCHEASLLAYRIAEARLHA